MSAERLRRVAADMREKAEAATPGPWKSWVEGRDHLGGDNIITTGLDDIYVDAKAPTATAHATQDHIAAWHPAVALAVADWLDTVALDIDCGRPIVNANAKALAVCDAWEATSWPAPHACTTGR